MGEQKDLCVRNRLLVFVNHPSPGGLSGLQLHIEHKAILRFPRLKDYRGAQPTLCLHYKNISTCLP
jgi:hypothetical protein